MKQSELLTELVNNYNRNPLNNKMFFEYIENEKVVSLKLGLDEENTFEFKIYVIEFMGLEQCKESVFEMAVEQFFSAFKDKLNKK